jgi:hypothetical protein
LEEVVKKEDPGPKSRDRVCLKSTGARYGVNVSEEGDLILEGWVGWDSRPAVRRCALRSRSLPDSRLKAE